MHIEALQALLKQLKLYGMRQSVQDLSLQNAPAWQQALPILDILLKAEVADREVRSVAYQMSAARFPAYRDSTVLTSRKAKWMNDWYRTYTAVTLSKAARISCWWVVPVLVKLI